MRQYGDGSLWVSGLIEVALNLWEDNLWAACDALLGRGKRPKGGSKRHWVSRCEKFAKKYFDGDIKQLTYCMKDVYNWKRYKDLFESFTKVDYTQLLETEDNTVGIEEISCAGGACLI